MSQTNTNHWDVVVVGGTPGGIMAAIGAARVGASVLLLERTAHVGGLPANGLGATDIATRGATGGLFLEFVNRIHAHYVDVYGAGSEQARDSSGGYHFEASVAGRVLKSMLEEHTEAITVLTGRQFDSEACHIKREGARVTDIRMLNRVTGESEWYAGPTFVDATYEGDLAAAAGAGFRTRREGHDEYHEPMAGKIFKPWGGDLGEGSTGAGDDTIQAYNYRVCLTDQPANRLEIPQPASYDRAEYQSLIDDITHGRFAGAPGDEFGLDGIGRVTNIVGIPNGKTDANNQHLAFLSTDLPEENYAWPTADWDWRDKFAARLRDYTLGLFWFAQNDSGLPAAFRAECAKWGLAKDEYQDNGNFPRQVYVREGRRIEGEHLFTAHDALPVTPGARPPVHPNSVTASHYALDSHAVRKREPGRVSLDGFFSYPTKPYTVPFGVMVPRGLDNVLTPVPASATHIGFSTLRMEPCWMALGQAAGIAAAMAVRSRQPLRDIDIAGLQRHLLDQGAVLIHYRDVAPAHPAFKALQFFGVRGAVPEWEARLDDPATEEDIAQFVPLSGKQPTDVPKGISRGALLQSLF